MLLHNNFFYYSSSVPLANSTGPKYLSTPVFVSPTELATITLSPSLGQSPLSFLFFGVEYVEYNELLPELGVGEGDLENDLLVDPTEEEKGDVSRYEAELYEYDLGGLSFLHNPHRSESFVAGISGYFDILLIRAKTP